MKKISFILIGLIIILAAKAYAYDDHDFQIWNTDSEEYKIKFRWGDNASEFFYQHYDIGYFHDLKKWFNVGGGYRQIFEMSKQKWQQVNEPYVTATFSGELKGFKLDNRSRMEFNDYEHKTDFWRYRNKTGLKLPWKFTRFEIQPYLSDEIFIVFGGLPTKFSQNRFSAGLGFVITKNLKGEIYYMLQTVRAANGGWSDGVQSNVLGTKIKLAF
ncbi:MAG: DUF2490 domain-containing protein [Candidatus Omnitrophica bacterium]|nr:DUF2490 domain-containing protein [Candidatus Omnitrophota bacterium]